ncbi:MAG: LuxR family transcriptional regulator, partial [Actinophytocola sp.]|nr:LuxR family transcriptional regulator [Actinophytocola sp.]
MTVVVGVDGAGRTYRLGRLAAASGTAAWWVTGSADGLAAARAEGSLVVVDDAHRLPADTLRALAAAARDGARMVMSRRPTIDRPELAELDEAVSATGGVELMGPLGRDELAALVATVTGRPVSPETAAAVHDASAGLAAVAVAVAAAEGPDPAPALVARVQRRFAILPPDVGAVGRVLALRLDLTDDMLATAAELPAGSLPAPLRTLRDEGLLVPGGERMIPAVAEAVLGELPAAERRR